MMKNYYLICIALFVIVALIAAAFMGVAVKRGALTFHGWPPQFNRAAFLYPQPSINREIVFPAEFTPDARELFNENLAALKADIETGESGIAPWFDLAIYYRMVGDHEGAVEIWEYIAAHYPEDGIALHNLGEYYFHTARDYKKAEEYYNRSIEIEPRISANYTDLYEMYKYVYKQDTDAALGALKKGIENIPDLGAIDLMAMLGREYRERGDTENARTYLTKARDAAQAAGNNSLSSSLAAEISAL